MLWCDENVLLNFSQCSKPVVGSIRKYRLIRFSTFGFNFIYLAEEKAMMHTIATCLGLTLTFTTFVPSEFPKSTRVWHTALYLISNQSSMAEVFRLQN